ncbi:MAG TPA: hypothetical protein VFC78_22285 [Tepidisphaeraceae bacterium]|nr:hypothetical protein [Tepidisphaeraceae bacterium]
MTSPINPPFDYGETPTFHFLHPDKQAIKIREDERTVHYDMHGKPRMMLIESISDHVPDPGHVESAVQGCCDGNGGYHYLVRISLIGPIGRAYRCYKMTSENPRNDPRLYEVNKESFVDLIPWIYPETLACRGNRKVMGKLLANKIVVASRRYAQGQR